MWGLRWPLQGAPLGDFQGTPASFRVSPSIRLTGAPLACDDISGPYPFLLFTLGTLLSSGTMALGLIMMGQSFHGLAMAGIW